MLNTGEEEDVYLETISGRTNERTEAKNNNNKVRMDGKKRYQEGLAYR